MVVSIARRIMDVSYHRVNICRTDSGKDCFFLTINEFVKFKTMTIIEIPTLEQIKEYFQSAEEVKSIFCPNLYFGKIDLENIFDLGQNGIWAKSLDKKINLKLWDDENGYAEIISYKDLEITDWPSTAENYDYINPNHYKSFSKEVIDMMVDIWGAEAVAIHCECCAFKYRMRLGNKPDQPIERDLEKAKWYEAKANELKSKIQ